MFPAVDLTAAKSVPKGPGKEAQLCSRPVPQPWSLCGWGLGGGGHVSPVSLWLAPGCVYRCDVGGNWGAEGGGNEQIFPTGTSQPLPRMGRMGFWAPATQRLAASFLSETTSVPAREQAPGGKDPWQVVIRLPGSAASQTVHVTL